MTNSCETANLYLSDQQGTHWEHYRLGDDYVFSNQIPNRKSFTRGNPGWVLHDFGYCQWARTPPNRNQQVALAETAPVTINPALVDAPSMDGAQGGSGALLLVIALIGSAVYAFVQQRNDKADFAEDYHPMSDAPMLPTVRTDEDLDILYGRTGRPQYQGMDEASPWDKQEILPRSRQDLSPAPLAPAYPQHQQHHGATRVSAVLENDFSTGDEGGADSGAHHESQAELKQYFESIVKATCPRNGYSITEEDLQNHGTAYQVTLRAVELGYSKNWICERLFDVKKAALAPSTNWLVS